MIISISALPYSWNRQSSSS